MSSKKKTTATKEDGKPAPVPKLRFPEFRKAKGWHVMKLNALLFEAKRRNRTLELGPADVLSVSGEHGCVNQIEFMGRSYAGVTVKDYHVIERGDIVYTKSPLKRNPYGIIKENKGKRGIVSTLYAVYRPFPGCSATYLDHFFSVDYNLNAYLQPIVKKGPKNDMKVNNADVLKGDICAPELPEQQKVAKCLSSVDELIAAQARKLDALMAHKKGLMLQLFPREGETQPRLRFPEFQNKGEWVAEPFHVLYEFKPTNTYSRVQLNYSSGQAKNIHYGDIHTKFSTSFRIRAEVVPFVNPSESLALVKSDAYCQQSDMIFADASEDLADVGKSIQLLDLNGEKVLSGSHTILARQKGAFFILGFAGHLFKGRGIRAQIEKEAQGTKVLQISPGRLAGINVPFPQNKAEQQRIADCLTTLDDIIAAQTQKLEALKTHKKGLMQQLFLSPEDKS
jgi:type I restriction enzyme S subunit